MMWTHAPTREKGEDFPSLEGKTRSRMKPSKGIVIIRKRWKVVKGLQEKFCVGTQIVNSLRRLQRHFCKASDAKGEEQKEQT